MSAVARQDFKYKCIMEPNVRSVAAGKEASQHNAAHEDYGDENGHVGGSFSKASFLSSALLAEGSRSTRMGGVILFGVVTEGWRDELVAHSNRKLVAVRSPA